MTDPDDEMTLNVGEPPVVEKLVGFGMTHHRVLIKEIVPIQVDWPAPMWGFVPKIGDRYGLEVFAVEPSQISDGFSVKMRPVKL